MGDNFFSGADPSNAGWPRAHAAAVTPQHRQADGIGPQQAWRIDPTHWALQQSAWRTELPDSLCTEIGRRLLLAELEFSEWILRRVEKVSFDRDRCVRRHVTLEFDVRDDAPVFIDRDGKELWLVPISTMMRRTLVNLEIRDEDDHSLSMPGIRLTQQLDQSILLAAAAPAPHAGIKPQVVREFVRSFVAGDLADLHHCTKDIEDTSTADLNPLLSHHMLLDDPLFRATLHRLQHNFSLYLFLDKSVGSHRTIRMSFDEPTNWNYQEPNLKCQTDKLWTYRPGRKVSWRERTHLLAAFGILPTKLRFQIPAAESAASYHFEIIAPHGVRIVEAALLAGRPNDPTRHVSVDRVVGHAPVVGLHAVEIPNGSLCRAQVDLRVATRGWLTSVALACAAVFGIMLSVMLHKVGWRNSPQNNQLTNIVLLLVTTSAGVITLVAQRDFGGVAARLVSKVRTLGALSTALPFICATFLVYGDGVSAGRHLAAERVAIWSLTAVAGALFVIIGIAWYTSWHDERRDAQYSPWDHTREKPLRVETNYLDGIENYHFDRPAVGIRSAEGWLERYAWDDDLQRKAVKALRASGAPHVARDRCAIFDCSWRARNTCVSHGLERASQGSGGRSCAH
jgi:hypothetical protein